MEKIPDITSDLIEMLRKLNINSIYQLAVQNPIELALECEDKSLNIESASRLIANARKILIENQVLTNEFILRMKYWKSEVKCQDTQLVQKISMAY